MSNRFLTDMQGAIDKALNSKAPLFVRNTIGNMVGRLQHAGDEYNKLASHPVSRVLVEPYSDAKFYLDNDAIVQFTLPDKTVIRVQIDREGRLYLNSDQYVGIRPAAANCFQVFKDDKP